VALVHPGFGRLLAHPFSSLALVTAATIQNPLLGQPSNCALVLDHWGLVTVRILVIISPTGKL
jgi:hypothetical protein